MIIDTVKDLELLSVKNTVQIKSQRMKSFVTLCF